MSRTVAAAITTAFGQDVVEPFLAVEVDFDSGSTYAWTGQGDLVIGSKTYSGVGNLLSVSDMQETAKTTAVGATISLSGIPSSLWSLALSEPYQGRACRIYVGVSGSTELVEVFSGLLDQMVIDEQAESSTITLSVESHLIRLERPVVRRYTNQSQQARYDGDLAFSFVDSLQTSKLTFGKDGASALTPSTFAP